MRQHYAYLHADMPEDDEMAIVGLVKFWGSWVLCGCAGTLMAGALFLLAFALPDPIAWQYRLIICLAFDALLTVLIFWLFGPKIGHQTQKPEISLFPAGKEKK